MKKQQKFHLLIYGSACFYDVKLNIIKAKNKRIFNDICSVKILILNYIGYVMLYNSCLPSILKMIFKDTTSN
ncbi:MAG: hypothetical protein AUJ97_08525 [Bacteroidetes bacterium CG2_30_32_10]|nr:MAG: hypothetical protein AUJ97_08525 [Bacteroidetes bacterium CG2_30_32_10]